MKNKPISLKKSVLSIFFILLLYILLQYTPIIYFFSVPLMYKSELERADAILVLGGGAGYEGYLPYNSWERLVYGVKLYKKGYASKLILSTGNTGLFSEAEAMKTVAIMKGVPEKDILKEDFSINSFENIKCSKEIIDRYHWKNLLIVSSPYHMKRIFLLCKKIIPDKKIIYAPAERSWFYERGDFCNLYKKIAAILHEYMGILWYYFKGYI